LHTSSEPFTGCIFRDLFIGNWSRHCNCYNRVRFLLLFLTQNANFDPSPRKDLTKVKTLVLALSAPAIGTVGQLLLKHVMTGIGPVGSAQLGSLGSICLRLAGDPLFVLAVTLYFLGFAVWLIVLSKLDLSYAYPILALSYCLVPVLSAYIFGERISAMRWAGIGIICLGVTVVGLSK
jgi:drug/metabolite transporter (DMT)-like permease